MCKIIKNNKNVFALMLALVMMLSIFGSTCHALNIKGADKKTESDDKVIDIARSESTNLVMSVGQANQRSATTTPEGKEVSYTSSNTPVAKVNAKGNVFCLSAGETVITETCGKKNVSYKLTVTDEYAAPASAVAVPVSPAATSASDTAVSASQTATSASPAKTHASAEAAPSNKEVPDKPADSTPKTDSKKQSAETSPKRKASSDDETTSSGKPRTSSPTYSINTSEVNLTAGEGYQLSVNTSDSSKGINVKWLIPSVLSDIITIDDSGYVTTYYRDGLTSANASITVLANVYRSEKLVDTLRCKVNVTQ